MRYKIILIFMVISQSLTVEASFLENSHRYLAPIDLALKINNTFSVYQTLLANLTSLGLNPIDNAEYTCAMSNGSTRYYDPKRDSLRLMGAVDPLTGKPGALAPTAMFMKSLDDCLEVKLNEELFELKNQGGVQGADGKTIDIPQQVRDDFEQGVFNRYFKDVKTADNNLKVAPLTTNWSALTPDSRKQIIENLIDLTFGNIDALVSFGYYADANAVFSDINSKLDLANTGSVTMGVKKILKYLMSRDEFLSY